MDRATDRIRQEIDRDREVLRANLEQLEDRVRSVVDWRRQFRSNPALWIGCAFGGALLLALATAPPVERRTRLALRPVSGPPAGYPDHRRREISLAWRTIESALIGVAAGKLKDAFAQILPGFREQLARRDGGHVHDPANDPTQH
jgi:pimeloyl-ACP methyl ester carboxylesterase